MASFIKLLRLKLAFIPLFFQEYISLGALELGQKLNASYNPFPIPEKIRGREIRSAESHDDFPLSSN